MLRTLLRFVIIGLICTISVSADSGRTQHLQHNACWALL